jgi:S1-C subfamily serine protease
VRGRSTSIPLLGVLALLLATAALPYIHPASNAGAIEPHNVLGEVERATVELFERASPSVVAVSVIVAPDDPAKFHIATGSGFIWDAAGNIVTNAHVVQDAGTITIWLASGEDLDAEIVGVAPNYDLAVVRPKLTQMNVQLHHVVSDITGVTGMRIVRAIVAGERDAATLAAFRDSRCKEPVETIREALIGNYREEHVFALTSDCACARLRRPLHSSRTSQVVDGVGYYHYA